MKKPSKWADRIVDEAGLEKIHEAVLATEAKTSAEIVPMIVRSSTLTGHVGWIVFLFFMMLCWACLPIVQSLPIDIPSWILDIAIVAIPASFLLVLAPLDFIRRICTPKVDRIMGVQHRALLEFYVSRINQTENHTGVLIFVSLLERRAVILADEKIAARFPELTWQAIIQKLLDRTKHGDFASGMCTAIESLGHILENEFPAKGARSQHELVDRLIVKE